MIEQRVIGHGEGQEHTIADVNNGLIDDLIAPRLNIEREEQVRLLVRLNLLEAAMSWMIPLPKFEAVEKENSRLAEQLEDMSGDYERALVMLHEAREENDDLKARLEGRDQQLQNLGTILEARIGEQLEVAAKRATGRGHVTRKWLPQLRFHGFVEIVKAFVEDVIKPPA